MLWTPSLPPARASERCGSPGGRERERGQPADPAQPRYSPFRSIHFCSAKLSTSWFSSTCRTPVPPASRTSTTSELPSWTATAVSPVPRSGVPGVVGAERGPLGSRLPPKMTQSHPESPGPSLTLECRPGLGPHLHPQVSQRRLQQHILATPIECEIGAIESDKVWVPESRGWGERSVRQASWAWSCPGPHPGWHSPRRGGW